MAGLDDWLSGDMDPADFAALHVSLYIPACKKEEYTEHTGKQGTDFYFSRE